MKKRFICLCLVSVMVASFDAQALTLKEIASRFLGLVTFKPCRGCQLCPNVPTFIDPNDRSEKYFIVPGLFPPGVGIVKSSVEPSSRARQGLSYGSDRK